MVKRRSVFADRRRRSETSESAARFHHNVYVVLLKPEVGALRKVAQQNPNRSPRKPCVYVGMTGLSPEQSTLR